MMLPNAFNVMPVRDKKPLISWKRLTETAQSADEKASILECGAPGNIGIVTGEVSNLFVLDIDGPEGEKSIEGKHIPRTWTVRTPHGIHYYFRWTKELEQYVTTRAGILEGVDVRGDGGYVVFYGWSVAPNLVPLASPPQWLVDLLSKKESRGVSAGVVVKLEGVREGNRNQSFASLAGALRARGFSVDEMYAFLESKAKEVGFPLDELRAVCNSIGRYAPSIAPPAHSESGQGESIESFLVDEKPVEWICKPFIAEQSIGIVGGLPESRKSWILVDLAIECARGGGLWMGKFPVKGCKVLLIDQERSKGEVQRRFKAVLAGKGLRASDIKDLLFVRSGTSTRIDQQSSFDALRKEMSDIRPSLVLVDSFATFHTREESNRMEIQQVMERIKQLRGEFNCAIVLIHHSTKMSYQNHKDGAEPSYLDLAGNVAIPAAAEMCLGIVKHDEETSFVHHTKATQGTKMAPFLVKVRDAKPDGSEIVVEAY
jgi:hypothetical protein